MASSQTGQRGIAWKANDRAAPVPNHQGQNVSNGQSAYQSGLERCIMQIQDRQIYLRQLLESIQTANTVSDESVSARLDAIEERLTVLEGG